MMDGSTNTHKWPAQTEQIIGLPVAVRKVRIKGKRMTKKEYDAQLPLIGRAQIVHNPGDNGKRRGTELRLTNSSTIEIGAICAPLFDPVLDTLNAQGLIIKGYEIESKDGAVFEHRQAWVVRPMFE